MHIGNLYVYYYFLQISALALSLSLSSNTNTCSLVLIFHIYHYAHEHGEWDHSCWSLLRKNVTNCCYNKDIRRVLSTYKPITGDHESIWVSLQIRLDTVYKQARIELSLCIFLSHDMTWLESTRPRIGYVMLAIFGFFLLKKREEGITQWIHTSWKRNRAQKNTHPHYFL